MVSLHNALDPVLERGAEEHIHQMGVGAEDIIAAPAHDNAGALISQGLDDDRLGDVSAVSQGQAVAGDGVRLLGGLIQGQKAGQSGS